MGRPNRQQHKVPRCYLEAFADESGTLWEADQHYDLRPNRPARVLTESDYYTVRFPDGKGGTLYIEKEVLGNIEVGYADAYRRILQPRKTLSSKDKAVLALFIASMMERVPARREAWEDLFRQLRKFHEFAKDVTPEQAAAMATPMPKNTHSIPLSEAIKAGEDVGSLHSSLIPDTVAKTAPIIFKMKWGFMVNDDADTPFITSDCPCVLQNPDLPERSIYQPGLAQRSVELTVPLSPSLALICGWNVNFEGAYLPVPRNIVHQINRRTMLHAATLISSNKSLLEEYIRLEKKARNLS